MHQVHATPQSRDSNLEAVTADDGIAPEGPPVLTVNEIIARHRDEWILMRVTGFDAEGWPERGYLLAHSPRRGDISDALAKEPRRSDMAPDAPYQPTYVFNAFPRSS